MSPLARIFPSLKKTACVATFSASAMSCDASRTVVPSCERPRMMSRITSRPSISTPDVGSSRKITSGLAASASAKDNRCCSPPDNLRHVLLDRAPRPTNWMSSEGLAPFPWSAQKCLITSFTRALGYTPPPCSMTPIRFVNSRCCFTGSKPSTRTWP